MARPWLAFLSSSVSVSVGANRRALLGVASRQGIWSQPRPSLRGPCRISASAASPFTAAPPFASAAFASLSSFNYSSDHGNNNNNNNTKNNNTLVDSLWQDNSKSKDSRVNDDENNKHNAIVRPQTVAVIGSGAVGCYYGARLWQAGHRVQFYVRPSSPHLTAMRTHGLRIQSILDGTFTIPPDQLELYTDTETATTTPNTTTIPCPGIDPAPDWILIAVKSTAMTALPSLILPLLREAPHRTKILVLMNGLIDQDLMALLQQATGQTQRSSSSSSSTRDRDLGLQPPPPSLTCCRTLYGGLAFVAAQRVAPGEIHHLYAGPIAAGIASTHCDTMEEAKQELQTLWQPTVVPCHWEDSLKVGRWRKMLWNLPFNGISVAMGGIATDQIVSDPGLRALARHVMEETYAVAVAECGPDALPPDVIDNMFELTDSMGSYQPSTMLDLVHRRPMEVEYLFRKPLQRAQALGVSTPHLWTIVTMIEALQRQHNLF